MKWHWLRVSPDIWFGQADTYHGSINRLNPRSYDAKLCDEYGQTIVSSNCHSHPQAVAWVEHKAKQIDRGSPIGGLRSPLGVATRSRTTPPAPAFVVMLHAMAVESDGQHLLLLPPAKLPPSQAQHRASPRDPERAGAVRGVAAGGSK